MQKTIILEQPGQLRFAHTEEPGAPEPGEALVRVRQIGVCGTDLHAFQGDQPFFSYPRILGHELGVEVLEVGKNERGLTAGTKCSVEPYFHCGRCPACLRGKPNCCLSLQVLGVHIDGGMREYIHVPFQYLHPSPTLSLDQLALIEPLGIGAHAVSRAQLHEGERVAVVGAGPIGLAVTQFAVLAGAEVIVMDVSEQRLQFCQEHWPQTTCLSGQGDFLPALRDRFGDDLPTAVFDATGNPRSMHTSFSYVGQGGRIIFVGLFQGDITFNDPDFHRRELTILSSRNATSADFRRIIADMEAGRIHITPWITHRATAEEVVDSFPRWLDRNSGIVKAVITM
ncbi:MAG TPA: zinc-binding alcohol dehydrogenase family protein [Ktedonobacteraceae bacterium]|jgi:2-desacetyl-2-hydroxyethyl bacteriochlorophyllide A dehydrogenase